MSSWPVIPDAICGKILQGSNEVSYGCNHSLNIRNFQPGLTKIIFCSVCSVQFALITGYFHHLSLHPPENGSSGLMLIHIGGGKVTRTADVSEKLAASIHNTRYFFHPSEEVRIARCMGLNERMVCFVEAKRLFTGLLADLWHTVGPLMVEVIANEAYTVIHNILCVEGMAVNIPWPANVSASLIETCRVITELDDSTHEFIQLC